MAEHGDGGHPVCGLCQDRLPSTWGPGPNRLTASREVPPSSEPDEHLLA